MSLSFIRRSWFDRSSLAYFCVCVCVSGHLFSFWVACITTLPTQQRSRSMEHVTGGRCSFTRAITTA